MKKINYTQLIALIVLTIISSHYIHAQAWQQVNTPPFYKHHSNGFGYNGKAYIMEGVNDENVSNEVWEYSPNTDTWVRLPDFPGEGRAIAIGDDWNDKYYYGFGGGQNGLLNDLWEFNPADTSWTQLPSCPCTGRSHPALIAHNDKVLMGTGSGVSGDLDDWWEYDMMTQEWTQKQDIPGGNRHHPFQFAMENYAYVGGGHVSNWLRYNIETGELNEIDAAPGGRVAGNQFSYNGWGFLLGGDNAIHQHVPDNESFMAYNPQTEEWEYLPPLPNGSRWAPSSFIIDDILYFFGGIRGGENEGDQTMWKFDLTLLDCLPPKDLNVFELSDVSARFTWSSSPNSISDTLKWRKVGEAWNTVSDVQPVFQLDNLDICQDYEFQISTECSDLESHSETFVFKTDGCCTNPPIALNDITTDAATLQWSGVLAAENYDIRYRVVGSNDWSIITVSDATHQLENLTECTEYELQLKSVCMIEDIDFGERMFFYTKGCGTCTDTEFCLPYNGDNSSFDFINEVRINNYINTSGNNGGYADFAVPDSEEVLIGESFILSIQPGSNYYTPFSNLAVWIDFNANSIFDNNEKVVSENYVQTTITRNIQIPNTASIGLIRMRIMYFGTTLNNACQISDTYLYGEAEDYCIKITSEAVGLDDTDNSLNKISVYPNPFQNTIRLKGAFPPNKKYQVSIMDALGKVVQHIDDFQPDNEIDLSAVPSGIYFLKLEDEDSSVCLKLVK